MPRMGRRFSGHFAWSPTNKQRLSTLLVALTVCWFFVSREETALLNLRRSAGTKNQKSVPSGPLFHVVFTVPNFSTLNLRCLESIFFFHPTAHLKIHSNAYYGIDSAAAEATEQGDDNSSAARSKHHFAVSIQKLRDLGHYIEILPFSAAEVLARAVHFDEANNSTRIDTTAAANWSEQLNRWKEEIFWFSNQANLLRLCLLYTEGGIYIDSDVILVRPMAPTKHSSTEDVPELHDGENPLDEGLVADNTLSRDIDSFHNAVLKFQHAGNPFLGAAITDFLRNYNGTMWGNNGPLVFGRLAETHSSMICPDLTDSLSKHEANVKDNVNNDCWMQPLPEKAFQPIRYSWESDCFNTEQSPVNEQARQIATRPGVYAMHFNNHLIGKELAREEYVSNSVCDYVLHEFCILCDNVDAVLLSASDVKKA